MTKRELYQLLSQPETLKAEHIPALERLVEAYPYAASFVYLYLYALAKTEDVRYNAELKRLSAYLPSREGLYALVYGTRPQAETPTEPTSDDAFSLIDHYLEEVRSRGEDLPQDLHFTGGEGRDYFEQELGEADLDLMSHTSLGVSPTSDVSHRGQPNNPPSLDEAENEQELFTETLAKIYLQQGKYERALKILRALHLHYPQKNRYFADQIRFLERLVANNRDNKDI